MPELPEIESIRLQLVPLLVDKVVGDIEILAPKLFIGNKTDAIGKKITTLSRKGKVLIIHLNNGLFLNFHLKLSGQLLFAQEGKDTVFNTIIPMTNSNQLPARSTRVVIHFTDKSALFFNDMRMFGWVKLTPQPEGPKSVDILSPEFTKEYLATQISKSKKPIKVLLMDQEKMAGIGNIYANDSLFQAKLHPQRLGNSLSEEEIDTLYTSIITIIKKGLSEKGSSGKDEIYVLPDGTKGNYQHSFLTYQRNGKPCSRCGTTIIRIEVGGRGTFYCPRCQVL